MERQNIEEKYTWDLTKYYKTDLDFEKDLELLKSKINECSKFKGKLKNKNDFYNFFVFDEEIGAVIDKLGVYVSSKLNTDGENQKYNEYMSALEYVIVDLNKALSFATSEIDNLPNSYLNELLTCEKFKNYDRDIKDIIKNKKRKLSKAQEELLSKLNFTGSAYDCYHTFNKLNIKFNKINNEKGEECELTHSNYSNFMESPKRTVRKNAFVSMHTAYKDMLATIATNYVYSIKENWFFADIRKYKSVLEQSLSADEVKPKVYNNIIKNTHKYIPLLQKGFRLIKKALKVKTFEYYDFFANIVPDIETNVSYDEAIEIIKKATSVLGTDYEKLIDRAKNERWIDVYPNKGKESGAYSTSTYFETPLVLTNFENKIEDVFTLAHELGHAMHSYYSNLNNCYAKAEYSIYNAEVTSLTNEILLLKYLYKNAKTKNEKLYYLKKYFEMFKSTWFRQAMFSEFEQYAYSLVEQKQPVSKEILCNYYDELNKTYHGKAINYNSLIKYEWLRIPHFYTPFYVYKYSVGIICAVNFVNKMLSGNAGEVENYINYLKSGASDAPNEILKKCGINLETSEPFKIASLELSWALKEMQKLI